MMERYIDQFCFTYRNLPQGPNSSRISIMQAAQPVQLVPPPLPAPPAMSTWDHFVRAFKASFDFACPDLPTTDLNTTVSVTLSIGVAVSASSSIAIAATCPDPSSSETCKFYGATPDDIQAPVRAFAISSCLFGFGSVLFIILTFIGSWVAAWKCKQPETPTRGTIKEDDIEAQLNITIEMDQKPPKPSRWIVLAIVLLFDTMVGLVSAGLFFFGQAIEIVEESWGWGLRWIGVVGLGSLSSLVAVTIAVIEGIKAY